MKISFPVWHARCKRFCPTPKTSWFRICSDNIEEDSTTVHLKNPSCGDKIQLQLEVEDGRIQKARFKGEGCSISLASAFIMTDAIKGKELNETLRMAEQFSQMMQGEMVEF